MPDRNLNMAHHPITRRCWQTPAFRRESTWSTSGRARATTRRSWRIWSALTAIEYEPSLSAWATENLAWLGNVTVVQGDGTSVDFEPADLIYVNAGATHPAERWLEGLSALAGLSPAEHTSLTGSQLPDGRISRVRLATMTVPARSSLPRRGLSAHSHTPRTRRVYRAAR